MRRGDIRHHCVLVSFIAAACNEGVWQDMNDTGNNIKAQLYTQGKS